MSVTLYAPAKINLWLHVFPPDSTGYHPLESIFCAIQLSDVITVDTSSPGIALEVIGASLEGGSGNLAWRAAQEFFHTTRIPARAAIRLDKRIPIGAGLGGGSSDAATVLRGLNDLHGSPLSTAELLKAAGHLGSDVPFFLCGGALAFVAGRGERVRSLAALPALPMLVVVPDFAILTGDAYRWLDDAQNYAAPMRQEFVPPADWHEVARRAHNTFERPLFVEHPELAAIKSALRNSGAFIALVSGSGSSVFGIYESRAERAAAVRTLRETLQHASLIETETTGRT